MKRERKTKKEGERVRKKLFMTKQKMLVFCCHKISFITSFI